MARPACFRILTANPKFMVLKDDGPWDSCLTITNDAERVVESLYRSGSLHDSQALYYYDSDGQLTELLWEPPNIVNGFRDVPEDNDIAD